MSQVSLKIKNYKCFGDEPQGFESIYPINIIIGRNNSGKSSLLDLLEYATQPHDLTELSHKGRQPQVLIKMRLSEQELQKVFSPDASGGAIGNHWEFGQSWVDKDITVEIDQQGRSQFIELEPPLPEKAGQFKRLLAEIIENPFRTKVFKRLSSERDLKAEDDQDMPVYENGDGGTNLIQRFINKASLQSDLVEITLLKDLNQIVAPDLHFSDIVVQQLKDNKWEVYVEEETKGRVELSQSGSGLKTILLVLVFVHLLPHFEKKTHDYFVYGFEEIENNLHPALQRRLFLYLREIAIEKKSTFFITTHSNVVIDLFSNDPSAQIIHVTHDGTKALANKVITYLDRNGVLDDLDVRASDLLQANAIVWVEGPSDRLFFNHWMQLVSNGKIFEGAHYQCISYGGRLLAHLTADVPNNEQKQIVEILVVNRNAIIIMDSDKAYKSQKLNKTKIRVKNEFEKIDGVCWITKGREIENYIPLAALSSYFKANLTKPFNHYGAFSDHLETIKKGSGKSFLSKKVLFAELILSHIKKEQLKETLDLEENLNLVYSRIKHWNGLT